MSSTTQPKLVLTIFGASGDLARIKLFPALYQLLEQKHLPRDFVLIGYARSELSNEEFRQTIQESIEERIDNPDPKLVKKLLSQAHYFSGQYDLLEDYQALDKRIRELTGDHKTLRLAYFSVPPTVFQPIIDNLALSRGNKTELRLILEKPFGNDEASAGELYHFLASRFSEEEIYLLDHYLGKVSVQSILHLRHANRVLNHMLKGPSIANIQITAFEDVGIKDRVGYFDQVGTIKDMFQSHLLQVLALSTMSIPISQTAESLHREKFAILSALTFPPSRRNVVIGQYKGYREKPEVSKDSQTETFAALRLLIDRESWHNVPIYIRTGKKLAKKCTYIVVEMEKFAFQEDIEEPNRLILELQPEEKLSIQLVNRYNKTSHYETLTTTQALGCEEDECLNEHAKLLLDAISGNKMHFLSFAEILATWRLTDGITGFIERQKIPLEIYENRSTGPNSQHALPEKDNFKWYEIGKK